MSNLNRLVQPECGAPNPLVAAAQRLTTTNTPMTSIARMRSQQAGKTMDFSKEFAQSHLDNSYSMNAPASSKHMAGATSSMVSITNLNTNQVRCHSVDVGKALEQNNRDHNNLAATQSATNTLLPVKYTSMAYFMPRQQQPQPQQQQLHQQIDPSEQLEIKYRSDMMMEQSAFEKADDVEFWQSLAQQYIGPPVTDGRQKSKGAIDTQVVEGVEGEKESGRASEALNEDAWSMDEAERWMQELRMSQESSDLDYYFDERNPLKEQFEDPFAEGLKRLEMGDIPSAALLFEAAVQSDPLNSIAWQYLGTTQAQNEKDRLAIQALKNCLKQDTDNQLARLAIAASLVNENKCREACDHLMEWLVRHKRYANKVDVSLEHYKQLDNTLNRAEEAEFVRGLPEQLYSYVLDKFIQAARMSPTNPDPDIQNSLGVIFNMHGEYDKAVDCFKAALSVRSEDSLLWNRLGATLANGSKSNEAVVAYRRALEISPGFLRSRYNLAISLIHLNLYDEAAKQLVQILNMQAAGNERSGGSVLLDPSAGPSTEQAGTAKATTTESAGRSRAALGRGGGSFSMIRARSITSSSIWSTLRTVATLMNKPGLYPQIDGRNLAKCNEAFLARGEGRGATSDSA